MMEDRSISSLGFVLRLAIQDDGTMWFYPNRSRTGWRRLVVALKSHVL